MTPFGVPVEPDVYIIYAQSRSHTLKSAASTAVSFGSVLIISSKIRICASVFISLSLSVPSESVMIAAGFRFSIVFSIRAMGIA